MLRLTILPFKILFQIHTSRELVESPETGRCLINISPVHLKYVVSLPSTKCGFHCDTNTFEYSTSSQKSGNHLP